MLRSTSIHRKITTITATNSTRDGKLTFYVHEFGVPFTANFTLQTDHIRLVLKLIQSSCFDCFRVCVCESRISNIRFKFLSVNCWSGYNICEPIEKERERKMKKKRKSELGSGLYCAVGNNLPRNGCSHLLLFWLEFATTTKIRKKKLKKWKIKNPINKIEFRKELAMSTQCTYIRLIFYL